MRIIPYALLGFSSLVAFVVAWALNQLWKHTIGYMFDKFAKIGIPTGFFGSIHPFSFLESVNNSVHDYLSKLAGASEHAMVTLLGAALRSFLALGNELGALAEAVEKKFVGLIVGTIPRLVRNALGAVWAQLRRIPALVKRVDHLLGYVTRQVAGALKRAARWELRQLLKFGKSLTHTLGGVWRNFKNLWRLARHIEKQLTGRHLLRLVHTAMGKLGAGFVFTYHWKYVGSWLTKFSIADIVEFVQDAVTFATETDMCKLAAYNYDVAVYVFEPVMAELIGVTEWFCSHKGESLPSATATRPGYLEAWAPSATPSIILPFTPARLAPDEPLPRGVIRA